MMIGILQFMPRGLRICPIYRYSYPALNNYPNKIVAQCNGVKDIENNKRYSTQIVNNNENALASFINATRTQKKRRRLRKWKYVLGFTGLFGGIFFYYTSEDDDNDEFTKSGLCTPSKPSDITKAWAEYMLTEYESRNSKGSNVIVKSFETNNAIKPGEGFSSQLIKLDVNASVQNSSELESSLDKEYHVMIKMPKECDVMGQELNKFIGSDSRELNIYSKVIPELNKFQEISGNEFGIKVPGFLYEKYTKRDYVLVIENANSAGYKPHSVKYESDLNHAKVVVENLAKLHAVSYSYNKIHNFLDKFSCYKDEGIMNCFNSFNPTDAVLDNAINLLELKNDKDLNKIAVKIKNNKAKLDKKLRDVVRDDSRKKVLCLTHGDCHNSNLLFRYVEDIEGNQVIDDLQFVDWQLTNWNSPVMDLQYFISICTTHKFRKIHLETLLEHYHSMFTKATTKMGTPVSHWTYKEFKKEYDRFAVFGLVRGLMVLQFVLSKMGESFQGDIQEESSPGYPRIEIMKSKLCKYLWYKFFTSPTYEKIIIKLYSILFSSVGREIISGTNLLLNDRILGLVLDADEQGLFDDESLN